MKSKRFSRWHLTCVIGLAGFTWWAMMQGITRSNHNIAATQSTYAARLVANMCVAHMKESDQQWPQGWNDLRDNFEACLANSRQSWTFSDLEKRVGVDWTVDPAALLSGVHSDSVIWVASDREFSFHGTSPNEIVLRYLKSVSGVKPNH